MKTTLPTLLTLIPTMALTILFFGLSACQNAPQYDYIEGETMGTSYHIRYKLPQSEDRKSIQAAIDARLEDINDSMSTYRPDSLISTFNHLPADRSLTVDTDFAKVFMLSKEVYQQSQGAFDPTVMPLVDTWGFGAKLTVDRLQNPPSPAEIKAARKLIDFDSISLNQGQISKANAGVELDFSAIAKGYGVDVIAHVLANDYKINNYMVEIGGEVATSGVNERNQPWQIAIDAPLLDTTVNNRKTISVIRQPQTDNALGQMHLATSGNYRNRVVFDGVSYSHTIDPISGAPVKGGAPSVTVAAESVALADAWATALTAIPYDKALTIATENNIAALFVLPQSESANQLEESSESWRTIETAAMQRFRYSQTTEDGSFNNGIS